MENVLTLVADSPILVDARVEPVRQALRSRGARVASTIRLAPETAVDLPFEGLPLGRAESVARHVLAAAPVDLLAQTTAERSRTLLVADLESTIIENEMLDEMAVAVGVGDHVAEVTARAMRGEIAFEESLAKRLLLFAGQPVSLLEDVASTIRLSPGAEALIDGARSAGVVTALITGGLHVFADEVGRRLGFDHVFANRLAIRDGQLTGAAVPPILGRDAKRERLLALCRELGTSPHRSVAIGDGANDLAMLGLAGLGVAYRAKPAVREAARARIDHSGLDTLRVWMGLPAPTDSMELRSELRSRP